MSSKDRLRNGERAFQVGKKDDRSPRCSACSPVSRLCPRCPVLSEASRISAATGHGYLSRIAFGRADQRRPQPFWDAILAQSPELMILMGDNVYGDVTRPR